MKDNLFKLRIVTPERVIYDDTVSTLSLPGISGRLVILYNHEPMIVNLKPGCIFLEQGGEKKCCEVILLDQAVMSMKLNECVIIANKIG